MRQQFYAYIFALWREGWHTFNTRPQQHRKQPKCPSAAEWRHTCEHCPKSETNWHTQHTRKGLRHTYYRVKLGEAAQDLLYVKGRDRQHYLC